LKDSNFIHRSFIFKAQEHNAFMRTSLSVNLLTKVFVIRDQNPILGKRFCNDFIVFHAACFLVHGENFMLLRATNVLPPDPCIHLPGNAFMLAPTTVQMWCLQETLWQTINTLEYLRGPALDILRESLRLSPREPAD
jgi:hypothetical protein